MPRKATTQWIKGFKGVTDARVPSEQPNLTRDLLNVKTRYGRIYGRGGMTKYKSVDTEAADTLIGLFNYRQADGSHQICRLMPEAFEVYVSPNWVDFTGDAFTATELAQPSSTLIDDTLVFCNGVDKPRKYTQGNDSEEIALGTSPYCKEVVAYLGFLFAINVSDDGTFTDVFDGHRIARYSDDWDNDWALCTNNEITLDETPGKWIAGEVLGRNLYGIKSDGVVQVRFAGGQIRFQQELMVSDVGFVAPRSVKKAGENGIFGLGTDGVIYLITPQGVQPVSYDQLFETLPPTLALNRLQYARALVDSTNDIYYLFYDRTGLSSQLLDSYVSYNYRTAEFQKGRLGIPIIACEAFKESDAAEEALLVTTESLVEEFDSGVDDDGSSISRYITSDWQKLTEAGWVHGARIVAKQDPNVEIIVDIGIDFNTDFSFPQTFRLMGGANADQYVELTYHCPPQWAEWANIRIRFKHRKAASHSEISAVGFEVASVMPVGSNNDRGIGK